MAVFWYELSVIGIIGVAVMALLLFGLFFMTRRRSRALGTLGTACIALTVFGASALLLLYDAPALFVVGIGAPEPIEITGLTYLSETLPVGEVRVDTDNGVYIVVPRALLPQTGTAYRVVRKRYWGAKEMEFLCLAKVAAHCWAVIAHDASIGSSRGPFASHVVQHTGRVVVWDGSLAGLGLITMFFASAGIFVLLIVNVVPGSASRDPARRGQVPPQPEE